MTRTLSALLAFVAAVALASCGEKPTQAATTAPAPAPVASAISALPAAPALKTGRGIGAVTAVDTDAGVITLNHEAIPAVGWPPMTMAFKADPALLKGVKVGDKVQFDMTTGGATSTVTAIRRQ